jgi:hypothetical protein
VYWGGSKPSSSEEGYAIVSNDGARVVVENTVFEDVHNPVILGFKGHPKGDIILNDCKYGNYLYKLITNNKTFAGSLQLK